VAIGVEVDPERLEVANAVGGLVHEHLGGGAADQAAAGPQRVLEVLLGRVVRRQRRGYAPLCPVRGRLGQRGGRHQRDARARAGGAQRGVEAGDAGADDGYVDLEHADREAGGMAGVRAATVGKEP
jgi:hypothetical protein